MAEVTKAHTGATDSTDVAVGDVVIYIDGQSGQSIPCRVLSVSAEGRAVDLEYPNARQPLRASVHHSDDLTVWHTWHFVPAPEVVEEPVTEPSSGSPSYSS